MEQAKRVSIHVAGWTDSRSLRLLLDSLAAQEGVESQILLVEEEGSGDGSSLPSEYPQLIRLRQYRRLGLAEAHQLALRFALSRWGSAPLDERFAVLLEPNAVLAPDALAYLQKRLVDHPQISLAGPVVYASQLILSDIDGLPELRKTDVILSAGYDLNWLRKPSPRKIPKDAPPAGLFGPCLMIRASALERLNPVLDKERPFADWSRCAQHQGFGIACVPEARVWRFGTTKAR